MMSPEAHRMMDAFLFHVRLKDWPVNALPLLTVPHPHTVSSFLFKPGEGTPIVFPTCYSLNFWLLSCGTYTGPSWTLMRLHTSLIVPAISFGLCVWGRRGEGVADQKLETGCRKQTIWEDTLGLQRFQELWATGQVSLYGSSAQLLAALTLSF